MVEMPFAVRVAMTVFIVILIGVIGLYHTVLDRSRQDRRRAADTSAGAARAARTTAPEKPARS
jgi:hypothetical protein